MTELALANAATRLLGRTHVWWWDLPERTSPADLALLGPTERARLRRYRKAADAAGYAATRAGARRALGSLLGIPAHEITLGRAACPGCADPHHGPPRLERPDLPIAVSISRTASRGVLALRADTAVGIDIEALRTVGNVSDDHLAQMALTPAEREVLLDAAPGPRRDRLFLRCWTRKEAVLKAVGLGLVGTELNRLETHPRTPGPVLIDHEYEGRATRWSVEDLDIGDRYAVAVARPHGPAPSGTHIHADVR
ncbi:4'-phosphopantetheinyl transferase superfamily protein [Streptomyces sp. NBC_00091]|uniref:4'-phosphopantetheinyl transferase family protein n=1 Tax=Streptomyces sp. NBC_00091 TaxID=2975648 RepID=UPI00225233F9|nr:4'-phosphopantetheinyl transferase superfamily protein [Streptomyces sp. NBC_00091]MCX5375320.1 4'-phosphopantetheinyl transferase superfamily protein [Streptomyces sp. NBC_00091]